MILVPVDISRALSTTSNPEGVAKEITMQYGKNEFQIPATLQSRKKRNFGRNYSWERLLQGYHFHIMDYTVFHVTTGFSKQVKKMREAGVQPLICSHSLVERLCPNLYL